MNGVAGSGKDSFVEFVMHHAKGYFEVAKYSIVDPIKQILEDAGLESKEKTQKYRRLISDLKMVLDEYNDYTFQDVAQWVAEFESTHVCFVDMRSPEDIQRAIEELGAKTIFVKRIIKNSIILLLLGHVLKR